MTKLTNFQQAIKALGKNDIERAAALGIPRRTLLEYKAGRLPQAIMRFGQKPMLLLALAVDFEGQQDRSDEEVTP
jgi:hypothetical protein